MLTFKLSRRGKKNQPTYRLLVLDKRKDPWGKFKEDVGSYNPHTKKAQFKVERIKYWLSCGAQPSATVHNLLIREKIIDAAKKKIKMKVKKTEDKKPATTEAQKVLETQKPSDLADNKGETLKNEQNPTAPAVESPQETPKENKP